MQPRASRSIDARKSPPLEKSRGEYPRSRERWERMLCETFEPVVIEPYHVTGFGIPLWHMVYFKGRARS